jgi:hypothetical protein
LAEWQTSAPSDEGTVTHDGSLGRQLVTLLNDHGESIDQFGDRIGLRGGERSMLMSGSFSSNMTPRIVEGLERLAASPKRSTMVALGWVSIREGEAKKLSEKTRRAAEQLLTLLKRSNESSEDIITCAQRVQLIALLEALLAELKGNFADRGRQQSLRNWLLRLLQTAVASGVENFITKSMKQLVDSASDFVLGTSEIASRDVPDDD